MSASAGIRPVIGGTIAATLAAAVLLPAGTLPAQEGVDARWLPWLGCWTEAGTPGKLTCVRPAEESGGVELVTVQDGEVAGSRRLRADGAAREATREGCTGTERAEFSSDGHRLYLRSDLVCEGGVVRTGTGIVAMVSPSEWILVETVEVAGEVAALTERYRAAPGPPPAGAGLEDVTADRELSVDAARRAAAAPPTTDDLLEASRTLDAEAVKTWLAERDARLDVDAAKLARLADAGVPEEVIDVVVAVSFPEQFRVDRDVREAGERPARRYGYRYPGVRPPYLSYGRGFLYDPFVYGYGAYGWWYGSRHPTVIVVRSGDGGAGGRVVNGQGYTRGAIGTAEEPASTAVPGSGLPRQGSVSPRGARSGSPSGSTGRKAKPRSGSSGDGGS